MLEGSSFPPHHGTHFPSWSGRFASPAHPSPRQNHLLAAMPSKDYERLLPGLEPVALPAGWAIYGAGDRQKHLYFLTAGIVSRLYVTQGGSSVEIAIAGNEGVIGVASFLGGESALSRAVVLSPGYAYRLGADRLRDEITHGGALPRLLLLYTRALLAQAGQIVACNRQHSLEQQLCCWILSCLDRSPSNELAVTHELIASMLGVRREGVTQGHGKAAESGTHPLQPRPHDRPRPQQARSTGMRVLCGRQTGIRAPLPRIRGARALRSASTDKEKTMRFGKGVMFAAAASALLMVLAGCPQKEGPVERAGKSVDKAMDKAGQKIEEVGESVQDAAKGDKK
jgi:CRP-like cAMP-binding protein